MSRLRSSFEAVSSTSRRRAPVDVEVWVELGKPLGIRVFRDNGASSTAYTETCVEAASKKPTSADDLRKAIGVHLGDDGSFVMRSFSVQGDMDTTAGVFIPLKEVKEARRRATQGLRRAEPVGPLPDPEDAVGSLHEAILQGTADDGPNAPSRRMRVLCRTPQQVSAAASVEWLEEIVLDFLEVKGLAKSIALVKAKSKRVTVAMPRILKPQEKHLWEFYTTLGADALLVRSAGAIQRFAELGGPGSVVHDDGGQPIGVIPRLQGDFSLNATNAVTSKIFLDAGLDTLALTFDCNSEQILGVLDRLGPRSKQIEVIIHSNLPIFHTEHCLFARFLSEGDDYTNCGRPCESTTLHIRDPATSRDHLVEADMGCRNTVFEASSQTAVRYLDDFKSAGAGVFRLELVDQPPEVIPELLEGYRTVLHSEKRNAREERALFDWMSTSLPDANGRCHGVSEGSLEAKAEPSRDRMKTTAAARRRRSRISLAPTSHDLAASSCT